MKIVGEGVENWYLYSHEFIKTVEYDWDNKLLTSDNYTSIFMTKTHALWQVL